MPQTRRRGASSMAQAAPDRWRAAPADCWRRHRRTAERVSARAHRRAGGGAGPREDRPRLRHSRQAHLQGAAAHRGRCRRPRSPTRPGARARTCCGSSAPRSSSSCGRCCRGGSGSAAWRADGAASCCSRPTPCSGRGNWASPNTGSAPSPADPKAAPQSFELDAARLRKVAVHLPRRRNGASARTRELRSGPECGGPPGRRRMGLAAAALARVRPDGAARCLDRQ